jgi:hypothetical protein
MSIVGSLLGIGSSIAGGIMGANAAGDAASVETKAAQDAQKLEKTNQDSAVAAQQTALSNVTAAEQPYQALGSTAATNLAKQLSTGFQAPTLADAENTPGYQFTLEQGTRAIDQNAAANGTLMTGNTGKALTDYGQGLASTTYQQDFQNAMNTYMTNYQSLLGGTTIGQNSTGQLANANLTTAGTTAGIDMTAGQQQAQQINNAAAARASGYLGTASAYSNMAGGIAGAGGNMASMYAQGRNNSQAAQEWT